MRSDPTLIPVDEARTAAARRRRFLTWRNAGLKSCVLYLAALAGGCDGDDGIGSPPTGSIQVTTVTAGDTLDPDGYTVTVDGSQSAAVGINDVVTLADLGEGNHNARLSGVAKNCAVARL